MDHCLLRAAVAAMLAVSAARANAQITTVISAPKRSEATQQQVLQRQQATQDSVARITLTGMTQWVDSAAAALALRPDTGTAPPADTASQAPTRSASPTTPDSAAARPPASRSDEFRDGARAPNTATQFPALALTGAALIVVALAIRRRPRRARSRAN